MNYEEFYREQCRDSDDFVLDDDIDLDDLQNENLEIDDGSQTDEMDVVDSEDKESDDEDKSLDADDEDQYDPEPIPLEYDGYNDADNY